MKKRKQNEGSYHERYNFFPRLAKEVFWLEGKILA